MATPPPLPDTGGPATQENEPGGRMSFIEHLAELRKRLIYSFSAIGVGMLAGFAVADHVLVWIAAPMMAALKEKHETAHIIYTSPIGVVGPFIHVAFYLGLVLASPVVFYELWMFVAPGLYKHEKQAVMTFVISSVGLFLVGVGFGYFWLLPYLLPLLLAFQGPFVPYISINELYDFTLLVLMGMGLVFELPVLIFFLSLMGVVTPKFLWKNARYAILIITIIAAVITPTPGAVTMLIFMAPMILLYFAGLGVSWMVVRRKRRRAAMASTEAH
jgi:sec-independent protein translocase protein TatC